MSEVWHGKSVNHDSNRNQILTARCRYESYLASRESRLACLRARLERMLLDLGVVSPRYPLFPQQEKRLNLHSSSVLP